MKTFKQFMTKPDPEDGMSYPIRRYKYEIWNDSFHFPEMLFGTDNKKEYDAYLKKNPKKNKPRYMNHND